MGLSNVLLEFLEPGAYRLREEPVAAPGDGQVLVKTLACGVCMFEVKVFGGQLSVPFPWVGGHEGVGIVAETGAHVTNCRAGDYVTTWPTHARGLATYHTVPKERLVRLDGPVAKPELWISEPIKCAVTSTMHTPFRPGDRVALIGCGYMGLLHLQALPKSWFVDVVALDLFAERLELARSYGATRVVQASPEGSAKLMEEFPGGFDVVIEASGSPGSIELATRLVREGGTLTLFGFHTHEQQIDAGAWHLKGLKVLNTSPYISGKSLDEFYRAVSLMKAGRFDQSRLITHRFTFTEIEPAMKTIGSRPRSYIKGVFVFE